MRSSAEHTHVSLREAAMRLDEIEQSLRSSGFETVADRIEAALVEARERLRDQSTGDTGADAGQATND